MPPSNKYWRDVFSMKLKIKNEKKKNSITNTSHSKYMYLWEKRCKRSIYIPLLDIDFGPRTTESYNKYVVQFLPSKNHGINCYGPERFSAAHFDYRFILFLIRVHFLFRSFDISSEKNHY